MDIQIGENITPVVGETQTPKTKKSKEYRDTIKFENWCRYFFDIQNKETYGNKTKSAIRAYNLDPVKDYASAGSMGYQNFNKLQNVGTMYLDSKGITYPRLMDLAVSRMSESKTTAWWDRIMEQGGYKKPKEELQTVTNTQINNYNINGAEVKDFNKMFNQFIEALPIDEPGQQ